MRARLAWITPNVRRVIFKMRPEVFLDSNRPTSFEFKIPALKFEIIHHDSGHAEQEGGAAVGYTTYRIRTLAHGRVLAHR